MDKEIIEGNKIIAEFMGVNVNPPDSNPVYELRHIYGLIGITNMKYHSSWEWLFAVVEEIKELGYDVSISSVGLWCTYISRDDIYESEITSMGGMKPIENTFIAVVNFINWYNKNKKDGK